MARIALEDTVAYVRRAALLKLTDQALLAKVAKEAADAGVRRAAESRRQQLLWEARRSDFQKLDEDSLVALAQEAEDPATSLAAKIRLGKSNWDQAFKDAPEGKYGLGDVLGAAALVDSPVPTPETVVAACHAYIRKGDASRIPELRTLLFRYGNRALAEDYLNCGRYELAEAGEKWAREHGFDIGPGWGSQRVRWGSDR